MSPAPRRRRGRGGQGGHEPRARIRTRELRAMELTVLGWSQPQIAADLGVSQAAVSKLLKRIETRLLRELTETGPATEGAADAPAGTPLCRSDAGLGREQSGHDPAASTPDAGRRWRRRAPSPRSSSRTSTAIRGISTKRGRRSPIIASSGGSTPRSKLDVRASRDPYDGMTGEALRAELARQTQLLAIAEPTVINAVTTEAITADRPASDPVMPGHERYRTRRCPMSTMNDQLIRQLQLQDALLKRDAEQSLRSLRRQAWPHSRTERRFCRTGTSTISSSTSKPSRPARSRGCSSTCRRGT